MKTATWILAAGLALGLSTAAIGPFAACAHAALAPAGDTVDLTPKYKTGQAITFMEHSVRTDVMTIANMPSREKAAPKGDAKEPGKGEPSKTDPAKPDSAKPDTDKPDTAKPDPAKTDSPKEEADAKSSKTTYTSTTKVDQTTTYELRVKEAGPQGVTLELEIKTIVAKADLAQGQFTWDSTTPPDDKDARNPLLMSFRPIVGAVMTIKIGADGNITGVEGDSRVKPVARGPLTPNVQALIGPENVREHWGAILWVKDGHDPVSVGQTWSNTDTLPNSAIGKFSVVTNNTLKSVKDSIADIAITGEITLGPMGPGKPPAGTLKDQSVRGSCQWDVGAGAIKTFVLEQKQTLDVNAMGIPVVRASEVNTTTTRE